MDLRIGAAFTRWQTLSLKTIPGLDNMVISYGSCQFPTLGFVVDRYMRVEKFVPEKFWSIKLMHNRDNVDVHFSWNRSRLFDRGVVVVLFERCLLVKKAKVANITSKPTKKWWARTQHCRYMVKLLNLSLQETSTSYDGRTPEAGE